MCIYIYKIIGWDQVCAIEEVFVKTSVLMLKWLGGAVTFQRKRKALTMKIIQVSNSTHCPFGSPDVSETPWNYVSMLTLTNFLVLV